MIQAECTSTLLSYFLFCCPIKRSNKVVPVKGILNVKPPHCSSKTNADLFITSSAKKANADRNNSPRTLEIITGFSNNPSAEDVGSPKDDFRTKENGCELDLEVSESNSVKAPLANDVFAVDSISEVNGIENDCELTVNSVEPKYAVNVKNIKMEGNPSMYVNRKFVASISFPQRRNWILPEVVKEDYSNENNAAKQAISVITKGDGVNDTCGDVFSIEATKKIEVKTPPLSVKYVNIRDNAVEQDEQSIETDTNLSALDIKVDTGVAVSNHEIGENNEGNEHNEQIKLVNLSKSNYEFIINDTVSKLMLDVFENVNETSSNHCISALNNELSKPERINDLNESEVVTEMQSKNCQSLSYDNEDEKIYITEKNNLVERPEINATADNLDAKSSHTYLNEKFESFYSLETCVGSLHNLTIFNRSHTNETAANDFTTDNSSVLTDDNEDTGTKGEANSIESDTSVAEKCIKTTCDVAGIRFESKAATIIKNVDFEVAPLLVKFGNKNFRDSISLSQVEGPETTDKFAAEPSYICLNEKFENFSSLGTCVASLNSLTDFDQNHTNETTLGHSAAQLVRLESIASYSQHKDVTETKPMVIPAGKITDNLLPVLSIQEENKEKFLVETSSNKSHDKFISTKVDELSKPERINDLNQSEIVTEMQSKNCQSLSHGNEDEKIYITEKNNQVERPEIDATADNLDAKSSYTYLNEKFESFSSLKTCVGSLHNLTVLYRNHTNKTAANDFTTDNSSVLTDDNEDTGTKGEANSIESDTSVAEKCIKTTCDVAGIRFETKAATVIKNVDVEVAPLLLKFGNKNFHDSISLSQVEGPETTDKFAAEPSYIYLNERFESFSSLESCVESLYSLTDFDQNHTNETTFVHSAAQLVRLESIASYSQHNKDVAETKPMIFPAGKITNNVLPVLSIQEGSKAEFLVETSSNKSYDKFISTKVDENKQLEPIKSLITPNHYAVTTDQ